MLSRGPLTSCSTLQQVQQRMLYSKALPVTRFAAAAASRRLPDDSSASDIGQPVHSTPTGQTTAAPRRRRRKLFRSSGDSHEPEEQPAAAETPKQRSRSAADARRHLPGSRSQQQQQQQQQQQAWWEHLSARSQLSVYAFWDLDNLKPVHWDHVADIVVALKLQLQPFGVLRGLQAYANSRTLVREVGTTGVEEALAAEEEFRCSLCGRRCKSLDDLQKHFRQLHEREHKKRMGGSKKSASKYAKSAKAARVRDEGLLYGTPKKNRSGRRGQMVKLLLQRASVKCIEVSSMRQAADDAVKRHLQDLITQLKAADTNPHAALPLPPSAPTKSAPAKPAPAAAAAAAGGGVESDDLQGEGQLLDAYATQLQTGLSALPDVQCCLQEMVSMSEDDLRIAWRHLKAMPTDLKKSKWGQVWRQLEQARRNGDRRAPAAPTWLADAWEAYHDKEHLKQRQQQPDAEQQDVSGTRQLLQHPVRHEQPPQPTAAAVEQPPWGTDSALQRSVLVIVSDDRGFASSIASWLHSGAAGAVLVTTRGSAGWLEPLRVCKDRLGDVASISWDDVVEGLDYGADDGGDDSYGDVFGWNGDEDDPFDGMDPYQWMVQQGLL